MTTGAIRNVRDYNGDIQSAINSLPASGGEVYIPAGTHFITGSIMITHDNISLRGAGRSTILFVSGGTNVHAIKAEACNNIQISDLCIDGNGDNQSLTNLHGVGFSSVQHGVISNLYVENVKGDGITIFNKSRYIKINDCIVNKSFADNIITANASAITINNCIAISGIQMTSNGFGVYYSTGSTDFVTLSNCVSYHNSGNGFNFENGDRSVMSNCVSRENKDGVSIITNGNNNIVSNSQICDNRRDGVFINGISHMNTIIGNQIGSNARNGIYLNGGSINIINSNFIYGHAGSGFVSDNSTDYNVITGNIFKNNITPYLIIGANSISGNNLVV